MTITIGRLFEELRTLRRRLADERNLPPYVVFGDTSLRHMAMTFPRTTEEFARLRGVGAARLQDYGQQFIDVIRAYASAHGVPERSTDAGSRAPSTTGRRGVDNPQRSPSYTHEATGELLGRGLSVAEIARERGLAETTVVGHLERLAQLGGTVDLAHVLPEGGKLGEIEEAFNACGSVQLKPVWEFLESRVSYDELRLARLHLRQEGRIPSGRPS